MSYRFPRDETFQYRDLVRFTIDRKRSECRLGCTGCEISRVASEQRSRQDAG